MSSSVNFLDSVVASIHFPISLSSSVMVSENVVIGVHFPISLSSELFFTDQVYVSEASYPIIVHSNIDFTDTISYEVKEPERLRKPTIIYGIILGIMGLIAYIKTKKKSK